jgi:hypothetical protein
MAYWNPFNEEEAEDAIAAVDTVFDVIYVVMLKSYPAIQENAIESDEFPGSDDLYYTNRCLQR